MKLATRDDGTRDGQLIVVSRDLSRWTPASAVAPHLQGALDDWKRCEPSLRELEARLEAGAEGLPLELRDLLAPLPRAYEWLDASAYLSHVELARAARGAELPPELESDPLVYQGGSGHFLAAREDFELPDASWDLDFEAELCAALGDTPRGVTPNTAPERVVLLMLVNDWTYRALVPGELRKGFGFVQSKPATACAPVAVTPDALGDAWRQGRAHLQLRAFVNDTLVGSLPTGTGMHFSFFQLVAHLTKTRSYCAGTLLGGGTISTDGAALGYACIAEQRARETLAHGAARTPFLRAGDRVRLEIVDSQGHSVFGSVDQQIRSARPPSRHDS